MKTGTFRQPGKMTMLHMCMILFLGCFFLGVFMANSSWRDEALWTGFLYENQVRQFTAEGSMDATVIRKIIWLRGIPWLLLTMMQYIPCGVVVCVGWLGWLGLAGGFMFTSLLERFGFAGIWQSAVTGFPQIFAYAVAYVMFFILLEEKRRWRWEKRNQYFLSNGKNHRKRTVSIALLFLNTAVYAAGIWLECYVNPWMLQHGSFPS